MRAVDYTDKTQRLVLQHLERTPNVHDDWLSLRLWLIAGLATVGLIRLLRLLGVVPTLTRRRTCTRTVVNEN